MQLVDAANGTVVVSLGSGAASSDFAFHSATRQIAVRGPQSIQVISWDDGRLLRELPATTLAAYHVAWHPGGQYLAVWASTGGIVLWDVKTGKQAITYSHYGYPWRMQFSQEGSRLLTYTLWDQRLFLWDVGTGQKLLELSGVGDLASDLAPDGTISLLRSDGYAAELWEAAPGVESLPLAYGLHAPLGTTNRGSIDPRLQLLVVSRQEGLDFWDLETRERLAAWPCGDCVADFDSSGNLVLSCKAGVFFWPRHVLEVPDVRGPSNESTRQVLRFGPPQRLNGPVYPRSLSQGAVDQAFAFTERTGWAVMTGHQTKIRLETDPDARLAAVSGDGRLAICNWELGGASVWEAATGRHLVDLKFGRYGAPTFSPDNRWLATTPDGVRLWRTSDWQMVHELHASGTTPNGLGIGFSADSRVLAVSQPTGVVRLVDPETGKDWAQLSHAGLGVPARIIFSPDQSRLITLPLEDEQAPRVWDLAAMRHELRERDLDWPADVLVSRERPAFLPTEIEINDSGLLMLIHLLERQDSIRRGAILQ
jgi:WD40 repeat protein